jgi:hypothetical protein
MKSTTDCPETDKDNWFTHYRHRLISSLLGVAVVFAFVGITPDAANADTYSQSFESPITENITVPIGTHQTRVSSIPMWTTYRVHWWVYNPDWQPVWRKVKVSNVTGALYTECSNSTGMGVGSPFLETTERIM